MISPEMYDAADRNMRGAFEILDGLEGDPRVVRAVTWCSEAPTVDWGALLDDQSFSSGEQVILACAYGIATGRTTTHGTVGMAVSILDERWLARVARGLAVCAGMGA